MKLKKKLMGDILIFSSKKLTDNRGFFTRAFCQNLYKKNNAINKIDQINFSYNEKSHTLRGYHYQNPSYEAKTISCLNGKIFLSILNLKKKSKFYLKTCNIILNENDDLYCYIPKQYATAFLTLNHKSLIMYYMSNKFKPEDAKGIRWNDPIIKEKWPVRPKVISEKDKSFEDFS
jgi:dTDP-4-dehydrorhamnose 3,5-epimerase